MVEVWLDAKGVNWSKCRLTLDVGDFRGVVE